MKYIKLTLAVMFLVFTLAFMVYLSPWYSNYQMKKTAFEWCGLNDVEIVSDEEFEITGNMFTRGCEWEFSINVSSIQKWIDESPGLKRPKEIKEYSNAHKLYVVEPQNGAAYGEVDIDFKSGKIIIKTYWS